MKRREYQHHHHHHHYHKRHKLRTRKSSGFIRRTINGLADKFGVSSKVIIIGFVVLFIFTKIFALLAFFLAYLWVKHPGKYEDMLDGAFEKSRRGFENMTGSPGFDEAATAGEPPNSNSASYGSAHRDDEFEFSDLKKKFEDLEKRANNMEEHVSSDEYNLNKEFDDIK